MKNFIPILFTMVSIPAFASDAAKQSDEKAAPVEPKPAQEQPAKERPAIVKLDQDRFQIGKVILNQKTKEIQFEAEVEAPEDVIEYLITTKQGKIHETLFSTPIKPSNLNIALKLLGYKESKELFRILDKNFRETKDFHKVDEKTKAAARFDIFVSWKHDGKVKEVHANQMILNTKTKKPAKVNPYVYGGSYIFQGTFKPDISGDLIAIFTDRSAIANFSNLGAGDDTLWYPNTELLPKQGSKVTLIIRKHISKKN